MANYSDYIDPIGLTDTGTPFKTALGYQAGTSNSGLNNTFIGYNAGIAAGTGSPNISIGNESLYSNTNGYNNLAIGYTALRTNTTGSGNIAIGHYAIVSGETSFENVALGNYALTKNNGGDYNVAIGNNALRNSVAGNYNVAIGHDAFSGNTVAGYNVAIGYQAFSSSFQGISNVAVGVFAAYLTTVGDGNTAIGRSALSSNVSGDYNTAVGWSALSDLTGDDSLNNQNNTAIGRSAGNNAIAGKNNTFIGYNATPIWSTSGDNQVVIGDTNVTTFYVPGVNFAVVSGTASFGSITPTTGVTVDVSGTYVGNVSTVSALNVDCTSGNYFTKTITGDSTFTVSNVPASGRSYGFTLEVTHTSGVITWFSGVEWPASTAPTLTTGKTHLFVFITDDGGTRWRGASLVDYNN